MNILEKIVVKKKQEVAERKKLRPLETFQKEITLSNISFFDALQGKNRVHLIAEIKRASPSQGIIIEDFQLEKTIRLYNRYASAMSVLTDETFFGGSFYNLETARKNSHLPLLCKDFIIDEYQIYEARFSGANAILFIAAILSESELKHFYKIATNLGMDTLFEVHDEEELEKVLKVSPKIVGVNNRNLKDFSIDHELTKKLSEMIPKDCLIVAESGIESFEDVQKVSGIADAMLVGTSIMKSKNPQAKIQELTKLPAIKICGITNTEDALEAVKCGASFIGLIFAPSPRQVSFEEAKKIYDAIKIFAPEVKVVGVFVNEEKVWEIANSLKLDAIQLHGDETAEEITNGKKVFGGEIWKSFSVSSLESGVLSSEKTKNINIDCILFDTAGTSDQRGGTGKTFNWSLLKNSKLEARNSKLGIAGGITQENIQQAREFADIIDVSSGVEQEKGKKDFNKLKQLFWNVKK